MGFRNKFSTANAIGEVVIDLNVAMNLGKYSLCLFLDLRKAFDSVYHRILIKKLRLIGFNNDICSWIENY